MVNAHIINSPVGLYRNAEPTNSVHERGALFFLLILVFLVFTSSFAHMVIASVETAEEGGSKYSSPFTFAYVLTTTQILLICCSPWF